MSTPSDSQTVCINFDSSRICVFISKDQERIFLLWRKEGNMNILTTCDYGGDDSNHPQVPSMEYIASLVSVDSECIHHSYYNTFDGSEDIKKSMATTFVIFLTLAWFHPPFHHPLFGYLQLLFTKYSSPGGGRMKSLLHPPGCWL